MFSGANFAAVQSTAATGGGGTEKKQIMKARVIIMILTVAVATAPCLAQKPAYCIERVPCTAVAVRTGILSDIAMIPNVGVEVPLGCRWSVLASWHGAWWGNNNPFSWKTYGCNAGARFYLGHRTIYTRLSGHHIGVCMQAYTFDFCLHQSEPQGIQAPGWNWGGCVEYGYSTNIGGNFFLDAIVGLGALWGTFYTYSPRDGHSVWQQTRNHAYFGPTMLELTLSYHFQKGGQRHE